MVHNNRLFHIIVITMILFIGLFLRVIYIDTAPPGLYPDEANNATNAYDAQASGNYQWFYPDNNGREGLYINLMAFGFKLFDVSMLTIKLPSIFFGTLMILSIYLLSRELFLSRPRVALFAAYLSAVSFWAINFSRIGFRAIAMLPITAFLFYFLFRGIRTGKFYNYVLAGIFFGLGFHTYIAFRIVPLILTVLFVLFLLIESGFLKKFWRQILVFIFSAFIVIAPIGWTFYEHPEYLTSRTGDVSIFAESNVDPAHITILKTFGLSMAKFNLYGDPNWRHGYPPFPMLEPITGLAFICGLFSIIGSFFVFLYLRFTKGTRNRHIITYGLLLAWFFGFLAPEFLTMEGLPHSLRSIGVLPVVFIFAALAFDRLYDYTSNISLFARRLTIAIAAILTLYIGAFGTIKYHHYWAQNHNVAQAFNKPLLDIAHDIDARQTPGQKFVFAGPLERLPVRIFHEKNDNLTFLYPDQTHLLPQNTPLLIYLPSYNVGVIENIRDHLGTEAQISERRTSLGARYYTIQTSN